MLKKLTIPASFSLIKKGKVHLLVKEEYKNFLLRQGIEDLETFIKKYQEKSRYFIGRTPHPSILVENGNRMVLRQYSHGGLLRSITKDLYLFGSRSFQELALTQEILSCGIPTLQPIGAIHRLVFPIFYRAYFLSLEIPHAIDLKHFFEEMGSRPSRENLILKRKIIRHAGHLVRQFHQAGFFHGDLQLKNILVAGEKTFLIDFDRSYRKTTLSIQERMKNLLRLNRSAEKWKCFGLPITRTDQWRFFSAYSEGDMKIREVMKKVLRYYSIRSILYQLGWALEKIVRSLGFGVGSKNIPN
jgi:tRNA A-37 threonylcarbamoyl transferase component Bud32